MNTIILNIGKLGNRLEYYYGIVGLPYSIWTNRFLLLLVYGCKISKKHNAPSNVGDRFEEACLMLPISTNPRGCRIRYSLNKPFNRYFHTSTPLGKGKGSINPSPYIKLLFKEEASSL